MKHFLNKTYSFSLHILLTTYSMSGTKKTKTHTHRAPSLVGETAYPKSVKKNVEVRTGRKLVPGTADLGIRAHSCHLSVSCLCFVYWPHSPKMLHVVGTMSAGVLESHPASSCISPKIPGKDSRRLSLGHKSISRPVTGIIQM